MMLVYRCVFLTVGGSLRVSFFQQNSWFWVLWILSKRTFDVVGKIDELARNLLPLIGNWFTDLQYTASWIAVLTLGWSFLDSQLLCYIDTRWQFRMGSCLPMVQVLRAPRFYAILSCYFLMPLVGQASFVYATPNDSVSQLVHGGATKPELPNTSSLFVSQLRYVSMRRLCRSHGGCTQALAVLLPCERLSRRLIAEAKEPGGQATLENILTKDHILYSRGATREWLSRR